MGKKSTLLGVLALAGIAIGGAGYYKKKTGINTAHENDFDDDLNIPSKPKKVVDFSTDGSDEENKKVTITFNTTQAKKVVNDTKDGIGEIVTSAKDKIVDAIGEEKIDTAKTKATDVKDKVVDKIGEDNINKAKDAFDKVTTTAKEKADEIFTEENMDKVKEKASDAFEKTKEVIKTAGDKIKSMNNKSDEDEIIDGEAKEIVEDASEVFEDAADFVTDAVDSVSESASDAVDSFTEGVDNTVDSFKDNVSDFVEESADTIEDAVSETEEIIEDVSEDVSEKTDNNTGSHYSFLVDDTASSKEDVISFDESTDDENKSDDEFDFLEDELNDTF